jgi:hypothetical protein
MTQPEASAAVGSEVLFENDSVRVWEIIELLGPSASDAPAEHEHNGRGRTEVLG